MGCVAGLELREEKREARRLFLETENVRCLTDYIVAIAIHWGVKQTPNALKIDRRSIYTIIRPRANFQPIPRTFSGHLKIIFRTCRGRVQVYLGSERKTDGTGETRTNASFEKHVDAMRMMTWKDATCKQITWQ